MARRLPAPVVLDDTRGPLPRREWLALRDSVTDTKKRAWLESYAETWSVTAACDRAGISRQSAYRWREEDAEFAARWDEAEHRCKDRMRGTVYEGALAGNTLLQIFCTKAMWPEFKDNHKPAPAGHGTRGDGAEHTAASVTAWQGMLAALGLEGMADGVPLLPAHTDAPEETGS
jgi:hypothetical protein